MTIDPADRPNRFPWPPLLSVLALLAPSALQRWLPLPEIALDGIAEDVMVATGVALAAIGVVIDWLALKSFRAYGTPFNPTKRAEKLVSFGLYNRSRNPMYLGALVGFLGIALATGNVWRWLSLPMLYMALLRLAVLREERHLDARFGEAWGTYAARVPRWW